MAPREEEKNSVKKDEKGQNNVAGALGGLQAEDSSDEDAETAALSRLRCTSLRTEEIADREKQKQAREQRRNRCADYPGLAFGSATFGSETMMK